jgi:phenylacetate-coenzyme A ligase PaaK-like adenylate-forming protein
VPRPSAVVFDAWQTACAYADALATARAPAATWRAHREQRLQQLLQAAARGSALYRARLAQAGAQGSAGDVLQRLRPVRKRELMQHFADWVADPGLTLPALREFVQQRTHRGQAFRDRYVVWESSGSSGEPALFVQDARALAVADALEAARGPATLDAPLPWTPWLGGMPTPLRIALVGATDGHFASIVCFERARRLNPWLAASSHSFSFLQPIERLAEQLDAFAPTVLATYPSMAWVLCEAQRHGQLHIAPRAVWTGGETLSPALRRSIGQTFGAHVHDSYGASECFLIANECHCGRLHLNADWVILEPVDVHGRPVPDGTFGATTLLTNLSNEVQPIIRYDLGDRVRIVPGICDCGSSLPVIEVQGRADDLLTLRDARGRDVHLTPLALTTVLEDEAGVFDFQLRHSGAHTLDLDLYGDGAVPGPAHAAAAARAGDVLRHFLRDRGLGTTRVQCHSQPHGATRGRSGKQQRVVCTHVH